jgi:nucleoside-diphosphate-sugar epimerase
MEDLDTNAKGAAVLAKTAAEHGVARIINFQTALCYGPPEIVPIPITHRLNPITSYGISKTAGESLLLNSGLNVVSLRLANVTGPRLAIGPIPTFYKKLKAGEGCTVSTTVRDFLDMSDFMSLLEMLISNPNAKGVYNVSTGKGNTILDIFNEVAKHLGMPDAKPDAIVEPGPDDIASVVLDPTKTMTDIGWKAKVEFEETIAKMLNWYDEFGVTDIYSHIQKRK